MAIRGGCDVNKLLFKLAFPLHCAPQGRDIPVLTTSFLTFFLGHQRNLRGSQRSRFGFSHHLSCPVCRTSQACIIHFFFSSSVWNSEVAFWLTSADILCASHSMTNLLPYAGPELAEGMHAGRMYFSKKDQKTHSKGLPFEGRGGRVT